MDATAWQTVAGIASAIVAAIALLITALRWRETALRKGEVLQWANEAISELQTVVLLCDEESSLWHSPERLGLLAVTTIKTSVLVERGRLFFKNKPSGDWGKEQEPAYQGLRPLILDQLVLSHQVACELARSENAEVSKLKTIAEGARKRFVSLAQQEVGRSRSASVAPAKAGNSVNLARELAKLQNVQDRSTRRVA